jgi:hypothetical protein
MEKETLLSLASQYRAVEAQILETGELTPEAEMLKDMVLPQKIEGYVHVIEQLESQAEIFKKKKDQYAQLEKAFSGNAEFMRDRLKIAADLMEVKQLEGIDNNILFYNGKATVKIVDEASIDKMYQTEVITTKIDKKKIEEDLRLGVPVPGAVLVETRCMKFSPNKKAVK